MNNCINFNIAYLHPDTDVLAQLMGGMAHFISSVTTHFGVPVGTSVAHHIWCVYNTCFYSESKRATGIGKRAIGIEQ